MTDFHDNTSTPIDMPKLHVIDNIVYATTRDVAEYFGKRHDDVLKALRNTHCSEGFRLRNFTESSYINKQGKVQPQYNMTRNGFAFLAMGFTGEKADQFKENWLDAFDKMERLLREMVNPPLKVSLTLKTEIDLIRLQVMLAREIERCQNPVIQTALIESFERVGTYLKQSLDSEKLPIS